MSEKIGVVPDREYGLRKDYCEKAHIAMKNNDEQFFDGMEALLKANYQQKEEFIEKVLGKKSRQQSFIVGQVFQHRNKSLVPQYYGDNFKNWLWTPAQAKLVSINAFGNSTPKEYVLPKYMNDTSIQDATNSTPMEEDAFWALAYLLFINPKLGKKILKYELRKYKYYIFHIKFNSGKVVTVFVRWNIGQWFFIADDFVVGRAWCESYVFLYPATS